MLSALAAAKQLPQLTLPDSLELTVLVARKDPRRTGRYLLTMVMKRLEALAWR